MKLIALLGAATAATLKAAGEPYAACNASAGCDGPTCTGGLCECIIATPTTLNGSVASLVFAEILSAEVVPADGVALEGVCVLKTFPETITDCSVAIESDTVPGPWCNQDNSMVCELTAGSQTGTCKAIAVVGGANDAACGLDNLCRESTDTCVHLDDIITGRVYTRGIHPWPLRNLTTGEAEGDNWPNYSNVGYAKNFCIAKDESTLITTGPCDPTDVTKLCKGTDAGLFCDTATTNTCIKKADSEVDDPCYENFECGGTACAAGDCRCFASNPLNATGTTVMYNTELTTFNNLNGKEIQGACKDLNSFTALTEGEACSAASSGPSCSIDGSLYCLIDDSSLGASATGKCYANSGNTASEFDLAATDEACTDNFTCVTDTDTCGLLDAGTFTPTTGWPRAYNMTAADDVTVSPDVEWVSATHVDYKCIADSAIVAPGTAGTCSATLLCTFPETCNSGTCGEGPRCGLGPECTGDEECVDDAMCMLPCTSAGGECAAESTCDSALDASGAPSTGTCDPTDTKCYCNDPDTTSTSEPTLEPPTLDPSFPTISPDLNRTTAPPFEVEGSQSALLAGFCSIVAAILY